MNVKASLVTGAHDARVRTVSTPAIVLPDTVRIFNALRQLKAERRQLAIVIDEHAPVDGISMRHVGLRSVSWLLARV